MTNEQAPTLQLDPRARAMLAEMGVRVWLPNAAVTVIPATQATSNAPLEAKHAIEATQQNTPSQPAASLASAPIALPVRREPPLRLPVMDAPPVSTALGVTRYVIANLPLDPASFDLIVLGEPCQGAAEQLLANLLKPLGLAAPRIFIAHMVASHNDAVNLHDQLARIPTKLVLALGPHAAKAVLEQAADGVPFSKLRGMVHRSNVIVTYHPQQLLRQPAAKAQTWRDIQHLLTTITPRQLADPKPLST